MNYLTNSGSATISTTDQSFQEETVKKSYKEKAEYGSVKPLES